MRCDKCRYWGNGDGKGWSYDAGHVNVCHHRQIDGNQHPSYGACGDPTSMVMSGQSTQTITTRWNFGCILFEEIH